jgi:hypothetical protein
MEEFLCCSPAVQQQATMFQPDSFRFEQQGQSLKQRLVDALRLDSDAEAGQFKKARRFSSAHVGETEFHSLIGLFIFFLFVFPT